MLCHGSKLSIPTLAWKTGRVNNELITIHGHFYFIGQASLFKQRPGNTNSAGIAYFYHFSANGHIHKKTSSM